MNKFITVFAGVLMLTAWVAEAWAHGSHGNRSGTRSTHFKQPRYIQPLYPKPRTSHRHYQGRAPGYHHRHGYRNPYRQPRNVPPRRALPRSQRLPRLENGILYSHPGALKFRPFSSPIARAYEQGWGVSPFMKAREKKARRQNRRQNKNSFSAPGPRFLKPFHSQNPWFLYGKGDQLRKMGVLPSHR